MKNAFLAIILVSLCVASHAQQQIEIDLGQWKDKAISTPFTISEVATTMDNPKQIGKVQISKNRYKELIFKHNGAQDIAEFIDKNFIQSKEMDVRLEIERLEIMDVELKKKKTNALFFSCKFYKNDHTNGTPLYTFNARNSIAKKNGLKQAVTNYTSRAITAAIANFKKSYKKHPEWRKQAVGRPKVKVTTQVNYNGFRGGDTIGLDGQYQLTANDFAGIVAEDEKDEAFSTIIITYSLKTSDTKDHIDMKVSPKAFFQRSTSWAQKTEDSDWLAHQQLLFDLASYHALQFKKSLQAARFTPGFYKSEVNQLYNEMTIAYFDEMDQLQVETQFGSKPEAEKKWRKKIDAYLNKN